MNVSLPKLDSAEFVTEFSLLNGFIGKLSSVIVTAKPELNQWDGLKKWWGLGVSGESEAWEMIE